MMTPPKLQRIGSCTVEWEELATDEIYISAMGGTPEDRHQARAYVRDQFAKSGFEQIDPRQAHTANTRYASWDEVQEKAIRLMNDGSVQILRNAPDVVVGHVIGDHGEYQTEISRQDPNSNVIDHWTCECPWDQFAWQRTRQWKNMEGRPCAHVLATHWYAQGMPMDQEFDPATGQPTAAPGAQIGLPTGVPAIRPPGGMAPPGMPGESPPAPSQQLSIPGIAPGTMDATPPVPPGAGILPPAPMPPLPPPVSVPGAKVPDALNPMQWPGGTFSRVGAVGDTFENSDMVRINQDEYGIAEGKSEEHGAGQWKTIKKNSIGEVLGQDKTTGWVDVIFPIHDSGPMEPYHIRAWIEPAILTPMPNIQKPGPFIKRKR